MSDINNSPILINIGTIPNENSLPRIIHSENLFKLDLNTILDNQLLCSKLQNAYKDFEEYRNKIFVIIIMHILQCSFHKYGNYLIREIISCKEKDKIKMIFEKLLPHIRELSLDKSGTFVAQELIKNVDEEQLKKISDELVDNNNNVIDFIKNENGKRVYLELIERQDKNANDKICQKIYNDLVLICKNKSSSFVIQKLLGKCNLREYYLMLIKICDYIYEISNDEFGHYIVSYFIKNKRRINTNITNMIYEVLKPNFVELSENKYGAFPIQDAIKYGNENQLKGLLENIKNDRDKLLQLSNKENGNFVVQKMLKYLDRETLEYLNSNLEGKKNNRYANYVFIEIKNTLEILKK